MDKITELRNKAIHKMSTDLQKKKKKVPRIHNGERIVSSTNDIGKTG